VLADTLADWNLATPMVDVGLEAVSTNTTSTQLDIDDDGTMPKYMMTVCGYKIAHTRRSERNKQLLTFWHHVCVLYIT